MVIKLETLKIREKIITVISDVLESEEEIRPEDSLVDDYGINSVESLKILAEIEAAFGIRITGKMLFGVDTVQDLIDTVTAQLSQETI